MKEYVSAGVHHDRDNAPAPICSMTQVDIWPEGTRGCCGVTHMLVLSSSMGMLNGIHRTTSDRFILYLFVGLALVCPCVQTSAGNTLSGMLHPDRHRDKNQRCRDLNSPQHHRLPLSSGLNKFCAAVWWCTRQFPTCERHVDIRVLRLPENTNPRLAPIVRVTLNHARCT